MVISVSHYLIGHTRRISDFNLMVTTEKVRRNFCTAPWAFNKSSISVKKCVCSFIGAFIPIKKQQHNVTEFTLVLSKYLLTWPSKKIWIIFAELDYEKTYSREKKTEGS